MRQRRATGERRNDLIDLMLDCVKEGKEEDTMCKEEEEETEDQYHRDMRMAASSEQQPHAKTTDHHHHQLIDEDIVVATAMIFMVAGYDTTGLTLSNVAYQLARQPAVQARLQARGYPTTFCF